MTDKVVRPFRQIDTLPTDATDLIAAMSSERDKTCRESFSVEGPIPRDSSVAKASRMGWVTITDHCVAECWEHHCPQPSKHVRTVHLTVEGTKNAHRMMRTPSGRYVL